MFHNADTQFRHPLKLLATGAIALLILALAGIALLGEAAPVAGADHSQQIMVVEFRGTASPRAPDPSKGEAGDWCFDAPLYDLKTDKQIGMAADCLEVIAVVDDGGTAGDPTDDAIKVRGVTRFELPQGRLVSVSETTVAPTTWDTPGVTHTTLAISEDDNILTEYGTNAFRNATGRVRISGAVNMSNFNPAAGTGEITFSCIFPIRIDR